MYMAENLGQNSLWSPHIQQHSYKVYVQIENDGKNLRIYSLCRHAYIYKWKMGIYTYTNGIGKV